MTLDFFLLQKLNGLAFVVPWLDSLIVFLAKRLPYFLAGSVFFLPLFFNLGKFKKINLWKFNSHRLPQRLFVCLKEWQVVLESFLAAGLGLAIARTIRFFYLRPRPLFGQGVNALIGHQVRSGFPSVHSTFFFALSTVLLFYNKKIGALFFGLSALIGFCRIIAGLHWPSDILSGLALGICSGLAVKYLLDRKPVFTTFRRA